MPTPSECVLQHPEAFRHLATAYLASARCEVGHDRANTRVRMTCVGLASICVEVRQIVVVTLERYLDERKFPDCLRKVLTGIRRSNLRSYALGHSSERATKIFKVVIALGD